MKLRFFLIIFSMFFSSLLFSNTGKDIFDRFCTVCHSPAMAPMFNSPAAHDISAWTDRKVDAFIRVISNDASLKDITGIKKEEIIINELVNSAIMGTDKGMPPKGTCSDCSNDDLKLVINFMCSSE